MEDEEREELLQMNRSQLMEIATFCNNYPCIDVKYEINASKPVL